MPVNKERHIIKQLGLPKDSTQNLKRLQLPFPMIIAWDEKVVVTSFLVNPIIHTPLGNVYNQLLEVYDQDEINALRINRFGGCYNYRRKRNSNEWSSHAWAIAVDHDPVKNALAFNDKKASFSKPAFKPLIDVFYSNGFYNLGVESNFDWMHFEYLIK